MMVDPLRPAVVIAAPAVRTDKVAAVSMFSRVTFLVPARNTARGPTLGGLPALLLMVTPTSKPGAARENEDLRVGRCRGCSHCDGGDGNRGGSSSRDG